MLMRVATVHASLAGLVLSFIACFILLVNCDRSFTDDRGLAHGRMQIISSGRPFVDSFYSIF